MATKKITFKTPVLTLVWPKLNVPDVYTPKRGKPGAPKYKTDFDAGEHLSRIQKFIKESAKKLMPEADFDADFKWPWKTSKDKDGKPGPVLLSATSGEKFRPPVFDAKNNKVPPSVVIGGGTKARLDLTVNAYSDESGVNLYINGVQVHELHESTFGTSSFEEADGFTYKGVAGDDKAEDGDHTDMSGDEDYKF